MAANTERRNRYGKAAENCSLAKNTNLNLSHDVGYCLDVVYEWSGSEGGSVGTIGL